MEAPTTETDDLINLDIHYIPGVSPYTAIEVNMYAALEALGVRYVPQKRVGYWTVDAYLPKLHIAVECDGCNWHGCPLHYPDEREVVEQEHKTRYRDERLWYGYKLPTLHVWGHNLETTEDALLAVRAVLGPWLEGGTPD